MIPFFRSIAELMVITQPIDKVNESEKYIDKLYLKDRAKTSTNKYKFSRNRGIISLPELPRISRHKWIKSKAAMSKFFDDLDYNNQIQSSYDLTLIAGQSKNDYQDAA